MMEHSAFATYAAMSRRFGLQAWAAHAVRLCLEAMLRGGRSRAARVVCRYAPMWRSREGR